jgi:hypothetical protein
MNRHERRAGRHKDTSLTGALGQAPDAVTLERLGDAAERDGCPICGTCFGTAVPYVIGRAADGTWAYCCVACVRDPPAGRPRGPWFLGAGGHKDPWSFGDVGWFQAKPGRRWPLRDLLPGEITTLANDLPSDDGIAREHILELLRWIYQGGDAGIAVYQVSPGTRVRLPFAILRPLAGPLASFTDAAVAALFPELQAQLVQRFGGTVPTEAQAIAMANAHVTRRLHVLQAAIMASRGATET